MTSEKEVETAGEAEPTEEAGELGAIIFVIDLCFFLWLFSELSLCLRFFSSMAILYVVGSVLYKSMPLDGWVAKKKVMSRKKKSKNESKTENLWWLKILKMCQVYSDSFLEKKK